MSVRIIRYSEAFKMQVLSELESSRLGSVSEAMEPYGIRSAGTVGKWIKKHGRRTRELTDEMEDARTRTAGLYERREGLEGRHEEQPP